MRYLVVMLVCLSSFILSAQKNFQPGYIINLERDTTYGLIDYKEWSFNPNRILFKPLATNASEKEYSVEEISYFAIIGIESYRRAVVEISLDPITFINIAGRDTARKTDTVFLKIIYAGKVVSLFSYADRVKGRFYILEQGQIEPKELIFRKYYVGSATMITEDGYRRQLRTLMYSYNLYSDAMWQKLSRAEYSERDLKDIILLLNSVEKAEKGNDNRHSRINWFAGIGMQKDDLKFEGNHRFATEATSTEEAWSPKFSAGVDFFANPNVGKRFLRVEAGFQSNKSSIMREVNTDIKATYKFATTTFFVSPQFHWNLYNTAKIKMPVGVGFGFSLPHFSQNQYTEVTSSGQEHIRDENYLTLRKEMAVTLLARASVVLNNKIEVSLQYRPYVKHNTALFYSMGTTNMQFQVYYLFRNRK